MILVVPAAAGLQQIVVSDTPYVMGIGGESADGEDRSEISAETGVNEPTVFTCHGAGCDGTALELHLKAPTTDSTPLTLTVADLSYGLPAEGVALQDARPENAAPGHDGDVTVMINELTVMP